MGSGFITAKGDEQWRIKRKACAHAFYKEKLVNMLEVMKNIVEKRFEELLGQIKTSPSQSHTVDISTLFLEIMSENIITVAFGEDINDELFELKMRRTPQSSEFEARKVNLSKGISECWE